MRKKYLFKSLLLLCALIAGASSSWAEATQVLSWSRSGTTDTYTKGFTFSVVAEGKTDYYQDKKGDVYIMVYHENNKLFPSTPASITFTAKVGGGSGNTNLNNSVYVCLVDNSGNDIDGTEQEVTKHITTNTGDTYNISLDTEKGKDAYGVKIYHTKETGYNVRYFSYSLSYEAPIAVTGIALDMNSATIGVGGTVTLTPTISPNNATNQNVIWTSSDDDVATVSNGVVSGVAKGIATITATSAADGTKTATCTITVEAAKPVLGVALDKTSATLYVDETETLTPIFDPVDATNRNIVWTTGNASIATVEDGIVTAVGIGQTTITATTEEGGFTATCSVTVNPVAVTGVTLKNATTIKIEGTETLIPTISPVNATDQTVIWESSDEAIATVTPAGVVTGVSEGTATITVETNDGNYTATCIVTVEKVGTGSEDNPYNVSEVLDGTASGDSKWVKGYIVGFAGSGGGSYVIKTDASDFGNSNWVLADSKDETTVSNTIPVQVASTNQSTWGLLNHPDLLGSYVEVQGNIEAYFGVNGVKNLSTFTAQKQVSVNSSKYATYCSTNALDFSKTEIKAYKAKVNGNNAVLTQVDNVPANEGVILYGEAGDYYVPVLASASSVSENEMIGVTKRTQISWETGEKKNYILQQGIFNNANGGYLKAYRAYLQTDYDATANARALEIVFSDEETTGIKAICNEQTNNGICFDLQGRQVTQPTKGLYIVNGKKVIIK